jgi:hypothetical protein
MPLQGSIMQGDAVWAAYTARLGEAQATLAAGLAPRGALDQAEGVRYLSRLIRLGLEMYLEGGDPDFPTFIQPSHATAKLGGDNPDNLYLSATILGDRTYRLTGNIGSVTYLSIGSKANRYAIDGTMASTGELQAEGFKPDALGNFTVIASQTEPADGTPWLPLAPDSNILQMRQTFLHRDKEVPAQFSIERISEGQAMPQPLDPDALKARIMGAADFVVNSSKLFVDWAELFMTHPNEMRDWGQDMFHKAGGDPAIFYVHGYWKLAPDEALLIETPLPECEFWNIQINNWWMESLDYRYVPACINKGSIVPNSDGTATIIVAHRDPERPNWLTTHGHDQGFLLLRWVNAKETPVPKLKVIKLDS